MAKSQFTLPALRSVLSYCPDTGHFTWLEDRRPRSLKGTRAGHVNPSTGYRHIGVLRQCFAEHRLVWFYVHGEWPKGVVDHINGDIVDNRISNLRDVSRHTNLQNQRKAHVSNPTGFLGVRFVKKYALRPWVARINVGGRKKYLGCYATAEEAHSVYLEAKRKHHDGCTI